MNIFRERHRSLERYYPMCSPKTGITVKEADALIMRYEKHATVLIYNLMYTNDIVSGHVHDALAEFAKSRYCRHEKKMLAGKVERFRLNYEKKIFSVITDLAGFFGDSADRFMDAADIEKDIDVLYWSLKQVFDDAGVEDSALLARMETARALLDVSVQQFDWRMKEMQAIDSGFARIKIDYLCMRDADVTMNRLMDSFRFGKDINLNTDRVKRALEIVSRKFADVKAIEKSISAKSEVK